MTVRLDGVCLEATIVMTSLRDHVQAGNLRRSHCLRYARFFANMADLVLPDEMHPGDLGMPGHGKMCLEDLGISELIAPAAPDERGRG